MQRIGRTVAVVIGLVVALVADGPTGASRTAFAQAATRTFSGPFVGSGTFRDQLCTYTTRYSGTVALTLTGEGSVSGTARHVGQYTDTAGGPASCSSVETHPFDETARVSGTVQDLRWSFRHGAGGTVAVSARINGNAVDGRAIVTDPQYPGSATIQFSAPQTGGSAAAPSAASPPPAAPATPGNPPATEAHPVDPRLPPPPPVGPPVDAPRTQPGGGGGTGTTGGNTGGGGQPPPAIPAPLPVNADVCRARAAADWDGIAGRADLPATAKAQASGCAAFIRANPEQQRPGAEQPPRPAANDAEPLRGTVAKGKLRVTSEDGKTTTLEGNGQLKSGDRVATEGEGASVTIEGGSRLDLGPNTQLTLLDGRNGQVEQKRGRVFYDIKGRRMTIKVPGARGEYVLTNRGTQFAVDVAEDGSGRVEVTEGAVEIASAGRTTVVQAGETAMVRSGEAPVLASPGGVLSMPGIVAAGAAVIFAAALVALMLYRRRRPA